MWYNDQLVLAINEGLTKVQDTMVYVPILKTLATLLKTDCVAEQVGKTLVPEANGLYKC